MPTFNGNEGTFITLTAGGTLTAAYRSAYSTQPQGYFYGCNKLNDILGQRGGMGIRVYFGQDGSGNLQLVLVGADANGDDMTGSYILDGGSACPPTCGASNSLNS